MLLLISLTYCAIIWLLFIKLKVFPWNRKTQIGAGVVGVVLILAIVILFGQGSPQSSRGLSVTARMIQIGSRVQGRVTKVHAEPLRPMKKGDPLFTIDPTPLQFEVDRLEALLEQTKAAVVQMGEALKAAQADGVNIRSQMDVLVSTVEASDATVKATEATLSAAKESLAAAQAEAEKAKLNVEIQRREYNRIEKLVKERVESQSRLDSQRRRLNTDEAADRKAQALERQARDTVASLEATLVGSRATAEATRRQRATLDAQLAKATATEQSARVALEPEIDGVHVSVRQVEEQLGNARFNLAETVVRAPTDGYIVMMALSEGFYVRMLPVITYVSTEEIVVVAAFRQNVLQYIRPGQSAEVILADHPGRVFEAEVHEIVWAAGEAQVGVSGNVPMMNQFASAEDLIVRLRLKNVPEDVRIQVASAGAAAVYTDFAKPVHIIRKIVLRMQSLLYWLP